MSRCIPPLVVFVVLLAVVRAPAHDHWLVPPSGEATVGTRVDVEVSVGMDFPKSATSLDPERMTAVAVGPGDSECDVTLRGGEAHDTAWASFTPSVPGVWVVGGETRPRLLEQDAMAFNDYLLHDGLPHVLAGRLDRGELDRDVVERYGKSVKALVVVGSPADDRGSAWSSVLGHTLEILPLADPLSIEPGRLLPMEVRFRGAPLEHANVCWDHPGNGEDFTGQTWTNEEGRALVPIQERGLMTIRLIHMTRPQTPEYEWESFWASLTFRIS